jgi:pimeloyl-ACP methyl ester carboxylesterase
MTTIQSRDGTAIAFEKSGAGSPVILVDGALCYRASGPARPLAALLAEHFTVYTYDRRGRGESGDTPPYAIEREVEDIEALVEEAGGSACLYGISSGAVLALEAANRIPGVTRLGLYEAPLIVDDSRPAMGAAYVQDLNEHLASGRRGDAVRLFMRQVGVPAPIVALMRFMPAWKKLKAVAHTLAYDAEVMGDTQSGRSLPVERWAGVTIPTLAIVGGKSPTWLHNGMRALADVLPDAQHRVLEGQTHMVKAKALAPPLREFFSAEEGQRAVQPRSIVSGTPVMARPPGPRT